MRIPLLAGNWKMYKTIAEAKELVEGLLAGIGSTTDREVLVCPPFTALYALQPLIQDSLEDEVSGTPDENSTGRIQDTQPHRLIGRGAGC